MRIVTTLSIFALMLSLTSAAPMTVKDKKGREIEVEILGYDDDTVRFKKGGKSYQVPWSTFDEESIKKIQANLLPGGPNTRKGREQTIEDEDGKKTKWNIPSGILFSKTGMLELYLGDIVHLEYEEGETFKKPKVVPKVIHADRTATFSFINEAGMSRLLRTGGIQKTVAVDGSVQHHGTDEFLKVYNIYPNTKGGEEVSSWPHTVWRLQLTNIEVTDKSPDEVDKERSQ